MSKRILSGLLIASMITLTACNSGSVSPSSSPASPEVSQSASPSVVSPSVSPIEADDGPSITTEKDDRSVFDDADRLLAEFYCEKLILSGEGEGIDAINAYFEEECEGFFSGTSKLAFYQQDSTQRFMEYVFNARNQLGDDELVAQPFRHVAGVEALLSSDEVLSAMQTVDWLTDGSHDTYFYGVTFDVNTGDLLTLDSLLDIDQETFQQGLFPLITKAFAEEEIHFETDQLVTIYGTMQIADMPFCYDGESYYLIIEEGTIPSMHYPIKWNGVFGEACEAEIAWSWFD